LRQTSGSKREGIAGVEENYTVRSFMICYTHKILLGDVVMDKQMVAAFSTHGREDRYIQCLVVTPEGKRKFRRT